MPTDIKTTGYQTYRDLQAQNAEAFTPSQPEMSDWYKGFLQRRISDYGDEPTEYVGRQAADAGFGTSKYDQGLVSASQLGDLQDIRYDNQPWYDTLANGVVKMLGTAGTTFLSSLIGLPAGAATAVAEGRWSGLWDNDVTQALGDVDDWLENNFKNYKSEAQEQNKWWQNMGTMNWWADDVIKNAGFTLGAAASMATGAGALGLLSKSLGMVNNVSKGAKLANGFVSALFSATGEGMIEARQGVEERNKLEMQKLEDALAPERNALEMEKEVIDEEYSQTGDFNTYQRKMTDVLRKQQELDSKLEAGRQQIEESGREMGNKILLGNQALLTAGNLIQFGKVMTKSFDRARHAAETSSKAVKPTLARATRVGEDISKGYKATGKGLGRLYAGSKGLITEGSEEMNQQWIQSSAGAAYNEKDVNDYWRAKLDPDSYRETTRDLYSLGNTINQGFQESWGDFDQWEQFVIGGMTGMAGSYTPTKIFNQDKTKALYDPRRYGEWGGGAYNEIRDFNKEYSQFEENVDDLNKALADKNFFSRIQSLAARTYAEGKKQEALERGDKKAWKDEDDKQTIHDIQAFLRAGKLDDLRAIYDEMGGDLSDEDVENIIKSTTREVENADGTKSYEGPFVDKEGNHIVSNDDIRKEVKHNSEKLQEKLDSYLDSVDYVNQRTGGQLSKDQEDNLVYLHNMGKESLQRADSIMANVRQQLPAKFLLKTNKTPEQLTQENSSSDLTFSKDEKTKEGYVEVDTSLMNDSAFTDFFLKNILWGGNIRPEFGETADERARREEEEKDLSDEEKRRKRTAKWKKALEDAKKDAKEQNQTNIDLMIENFLNNYRKDNRASDAESIEALNSMLEDVADASALLEQHGEFEKTLQEYMANPEKVERDKEKEEKKAEKKNKEEDAKSKFGGKTAKEIKNDIDSGNTDYNDLDAFLKGSSDGSITASEEDTTAAREAKNMYDKQRSLEGFLEGSTNATAISDAKQMIQWLGQSAENADDITVEGLSQYNADNLISEDEAAYMYQQGYDDLRIHEQAEARKQQALNALSAGIEAWQADQDKKSLVSTEGEGEAGNFDFGDTGHDSTSKSPSNEGKDDTAPEAPRTNTEEPATVSEGDAEAAINEAQEAQESIESTNGGTWRNTTRRYGRTRGTNGRWHNVQIPYHETLGDKNSLLYKRSKAIYDFLNSDEVRAFDHVENASEDRIKPNDTIRFRIKSFAQEIFGKDFASLNDKEKRQSIVILMVDDKDNVLGDLPLPELEPRQTEDVKELQDLHDKIADAFIKRNEKDGTLDVLADGKEGLDLKFKNGKPLRGQIFEVKTGFVPYSDTRMSLNTIYTDASGAISPFELAIKVLEGQINTGHKKTVNAVGSGKVGQSYILLPDASGRKMAVPFATPVFDASSMQDTKIYAFLTEALSQLEKYSDKEDAKAGRHKEERNRAIDTICSLLQIENVFLDTDAKDRVVFKYTHLGEKDKQKIEIPTSGDWKSMLLSALSGTKIQIALRHINGNLSVGNRTEKYNEIIGEIAHTNLSQGIRHTAGSWFTIRKLSEEGVQKTKQTKYPEGVTQEFTLNSGRKVIITTGNTWSAADPNTGNPIVDDLEVDLYMAQMQAANKDKTTGKIKVDINGELRTYSIDDDAFVKDNKPAPVLRTGTGYSAVATSKPKEVAVQQQSAEKPVPRNPMDDFMEAFGGSWNPGTPEEAEGAGGRKESSSTTNAVTQSQPAEKKMTVEEAERRAKGLGILGVRTQHAWNALPQDIKIQLMEGNRVEVTFNNKTKVLSVNTVQETIKTLQEWNAAAKRNPQGITSKVLYRRADREAKKADLQRERKWLQDNLPMFNSEERLHLLQGLLEIPGEQQWAWGRFEKGIITLSDMAARGTLYHEAFHAVTQTLLSDEELDTLYEAAVKHYKESNVALVEELLAEDFRRYVQRGETPIIGKILKFFRKIMNAIRNISGYKAPIQQLFYRINNGEFKDAVPKEARSGNAFYQRVRTDRLLPKDHPMSKAIEEAFNKKNWEGKSKGKQWTNFKKAWVAEGYTPVIGTHYINDGKNIAYHWIGVRTNEDEEISKRERRRDNRKRREAEQHQAEQAYRGMEMKHTWSFLSNESQMNLMDAGITEDAFNSMSVGEQEQYLNCHG